MAQQGNLPLSTLPLGDVTPEYLAQTRVPEILTGSILPAALATLFVFARFYSRAVIMKNWGYDDTWILVSWVIGSVCLTALNWVLTEHGAGRHLLAQKPADLGISFTVGFAGRVLYQVSLVTTKLAICTFYLRVFQDRWSKIFVWSVIGCVLAYGVPFVIFPFAACRPIEAAWSDIAATCSNPNPPIIASAVLNILTDTALLAFVVPKIIGLQITTRQKISLLSIACLSVCVIVAAIVRVTRVIQVSNSQDITWDTYDITIWSSVEINTAIFCASAAAIKPLLRKIAPSFLSSHETSVSYDGSRSMRGICGTRTLSSRKGHHLGGGAIELSSQTDLEFSTPSNTMNNFGVKPTRQKTSTSDDSEAGVFGLKSLRGEIRKTSEVTVTVTHPNRGGQEIGRSHSAHVLEY